MDNPGSVNIVVGPITPFKSDGELNLVALNDEVEYVLKAGATEIVAAGYLIQDFPLLSIAERKMLIEETASSVDKKVPLVAGINGRTTLEARELIEFVKSLPIAKVMSGVPFGKKPTAHEIRGYFDFVNRHAPAPILLYNQSPLGVDLAGESVGDLMKFSNVCSIKETTQDFARIQGTFKITKRLKKQLYTTSGVMFPSLSLGIRNISVPPILVKLAGRLARAYDQGDLELASEMQDAILEFHGIGIKKSSSSIYRAGFRILGIDLGYERGPYSDLERGEEKIVENFLKRTGIL